MDCHILIDDRERAVITVLSAAPWWRVQRLTYGDYALARGETIIMIIERKTYADLAQSFKDNRIANFAGLTAFRAEFPDVELALLIEGHRPHDETEKINGISYRNIRAKINHLRLRDKFHIFETHDIIDTATCLGGLVVDATTLYRGTTVTGSNERTVTQHAPPRSIADEVRGMFEAFPGVGPKNADAIMRAGMSIASFTQDQTSTTTIRRLTTRYRQNRTEAIDCAILASVTRVTVTIAQALLDFAKDESGMTSLAHLCALTREQLADFRYKGMKRTKLCTLLWECLHYSTSP